MIVSSSMHPYYAMLSTTGKNLYIEMLRYAISGARKFNVKTKTTVVVAKQAFTAMYFDHPQLFWLDGSSVYETQNDILVSFEFGFNSLAKNLSRNQSNLKAAIERYLKDVRGKAPYMQEKIVHDRIVRNVRYEHVGCHQTSYAALVEGKAVCAGYARGFQLLMQELGIPCYYCSGNAYKKGEKTMSQHAWNIIKLGNDFYNVDITWNDGYEEVNPNWVSYTYYNCTDAAMSKTHFRRDDSRKLPSCNGVKYAFDKINNGVDANLEFVYQHGVTSKRPVRTESEMKSIAFNMLSSPQKRSVMSFPVNSMRLIERLNDIFGEALRMPGVKCRGYHIRTNYWDFGNGWLKLEIDLTKE